MKAKRVRFSPLLAACLLLFGQKPFAQNFAAGPGLRPAPLARALAVGVSAYQDPALPALPNARTDAESFAAFLKTAVPGGPAREDIRRLLDSAATLAQFAQALDWLLDESRPGDRATVFFSGAAYQNTETHLLFFDSPPSPTEAGSFSLEALLRLLSGLFEKKQVDFNLVAEFQPFSPGENPPPPVWDDTENSRFFSLAKISAEKLPGKKPPSAVQTFAHHLQRGLFGAADRDGDLTVEAGELARFAARLPAARVLPKNRLCLAASNRRLPLARVSEFARARLDENGGGNLAPVVGLESNRRTDSLLALAGGAGIWQDFVLALKLGNFLPTDGPRCAAEGYDSLLRMPALGPLFGNFRRMFAAALLDDSQQALNAYLNSSTRELARRRREGPRAYHRYPPLLARASELLGERHYMRKLLEAKRLYFEGLVLRLDAQQAAGDSALLRAALRKQHAALDFEPEAAFVLNEIGVEHALLGEHGPALAFFRQAAELAPAWGVPHSNISFALAEQGDFPAAIESGLRGIALGPWNASAYSLLGNIYQKTGDLAAAETLWRRAFKNDPTDCATAYNIACLRARAADRPGAFEWLGAALECGFADTNLLRTDPDLDNLRQTTEWAALAGRFFPVEAKH